MAPVGSYESLHAAIEAGADAVYFGVEGLNMRARSSVNFTLDDLRRIASICDAAGVKTYLTVNTIIYDNEIDKCREVIDAVSQSGITAIIASDIAAIEYARSIGVEVHISTQVNVSNTEAVRFYSRWADVMVLARELSLDQVAAIHRAITEQDIRGPKGEPIRLEMFCHGALCMAVSGKCYLSLHEMNSSANRGACTQICRRGYRVTDIETGDELQVDNKYIMSPKDLKTIHFLNKMIDAGVRVFKIEGRARGPEYVALTVRAYSEAIQAICDGTYSDEMISRWDTSLSRVFNRGFWDGYYMGQRLGEWSSKYGSSATKVKRYIAKGVRYFPPSRRRRISHGSRRAPPRRRNRHHRHRHRSHHHESRRTASRLRPRARRHQRPELLTARPPQNPPLRPHVSLAGHHPRRPQALTQTSDL